jgi:hypothetical protein
MPDQGNGRLAAVATISLAAFRPPQIAAIGDADTDAGYFY